MPGVTSRTKRCPHVVELIWLVVFSLDDFDFNAVVANLFWSVTPVIPDLKVLSWTLLTKASDHGAGFYISHILEWKKTITCGSDSWMVENVSQQTRDTEGLGLLVLSDLIVLIVTCC